MLKKQPSNVEIAVCPTCGEAYLTLCRQIEPTMQIPIAYWWQCSECFTVTEQVNTLADSEKLVGWQRKI